jgi:hypothetical protein
MSAACLRLLTRTLLNPINLLDLIETLGRKANPPSLGKVRLESVVELAPHMREAGDMHDVVTCTLERFQLDVNRNSHRGFPRPCKSEIRVALTATAGWRDGKGILQRS